MVTALTLALKLEYHLFKKEQALLRKVVPLKWQGRLRRRVRARLLVWGARSYHAWLEKRLAERRTQYACPLEPGLLSVVTPVWDGTPLEYFRLLAESIIGQNTAGTAEWVILNNGCQKPEILEYLAELKRYPWVSLAESPSNTGITGGLRLCLEHATGRYILPVDSDDKLYPDCLQVVAWWVKHTGFPPLLYSDEDKIIGAHVVQPYLKPDYDPVLLSNSPYIAHLGVIDRKLALELGAYTDKTTEGSPDWDLFIRFYLAGQHAVHIPEVIYSWRMHPESTAEDAASKPYIHSSQQAVLQRYLDGSKLSAKYSIEYSPLLNGTADWWLQRHPGAGSPPAVLVGLEIGPAPSARQSDLPFSARLSLPAVASVHALVQKLEGRAGDDALICLISDDLEIDREDWLSDAIGLFERHSDAGMIGGRIRDADGATVAAAYVLGFGGNCACPDRGRPVLDAGYFAQMAKHRSVSAVSSQFCVLRAGFLRSLAQTLPAGATIPFLGAWAGAYSLRNQRRIIYSPYLSGVSKLNWDALTAASEMAEFHRTHRELLPDYRFYSKYFGTNFAQAYQLSEESVSSFFPSSRRKSTGT